jgi:hypothetical protein
MNDTTTSFHSIEIPLNKKKMAFLLALSLVLFSIGLWIVFGNPEVENTSGFHSTKLQIAGYGAILLFGLTTIALSKKIFDTSPGLVIDNNGITDSAGALSGGLVLWSDIENISKFQVQGQDFLLIQVKNPDYYIDRQTSTLKRKAMSLNKKLYGTPIFISANTLNINFQELFQTVNYRFQQNKLSL